MGGKKSDKTTVPYSQSDTHRRVQESLEKSKQRREQRAHQREEQVVVARQKEKEFDYESLTQEISLIGLSLNKASKKGDSNKLGQIGAWVGVSPEVAPPSVVAVYELAQALCHYKGPLAEDNQVHRWNMIVGLRDKMNDFMDNTAGLKNKDPRYLAAVDAFKLDVRGVLDTNFKGLAAENSFMNAVRDIINDIRKYIGWEPNRSLASTSLIQSDTVNQAFGDVRDQGMGTDAQEELNVDIHSSPRHQ